MANKVSIKKSKKTEGQSYDLTFSHLTPGEILSLKNALERHAASGSDVAKDVLMYLTNGVATSDHPFLHGLFT